jgi:hypothetical protein
VSLLCHYSRLKTDEIEGNQRWASQVRLSMFVCRVVVHRNNCGSHFAVNESGSVSDRAAAAHDLDALFKKSPESDRHDQGLYLCIHHRNSGRNRQHRIPGGDVQTEGQHPLWFHG